MSRTGAGAAVWLDEGLRAALHKDGCRLLQQLLEDPQLVIPGNQALPGEKCHPQRLKTLGTVLGPVPLRRPYFYRPPRHQDDPGQGRFPLDEALGVVDGYSRGMAKLMCRAGAMASGYEAAAVDLKAYAGLEVEGRQIQRMLNLQAPEIARHAGHCSPSQPVKAVNVFYIGIDGTGVPMMLQELENRAGKQEDGSAKTREVKLGCVFTQLSTDDQNHPLRDPDSTTYRSSFVCAKDFGPLIRAHALQRGMAVASVVVVLGDGAAWIWEIARTCFDFAVHIVDFFHACEHLTALTEALFGPAAPLAQEYQQRWRAYLEVDQVGALIQEATRGLAHPKAAVEEGRKQIGYFETNQSRMLYGSYREAGYFIGSGVIEAGCKTVVGQRVKQSGMLWSLKGADNVLSVRCAVMNGVFDGFWQQGDLFAETKKAA